MSSGRLFSMGRNSCEIYIRKTGYRDLITGDYILMLNGREIGVYQNWDLFFEGFSAPFNYPAIPKIQEEDDLLIKFRQRIIYKKLVPPFNLLYLFRFFG
jgi:hypothetical protein